MTDEKNPGDCSASSSNSIAPKSRPIVFSLVGSVPSTQYCPPSIYKPCVPELKGVSRINHVLQPTDNASAPTDLVVRLPGIDGFDYGVNSHEFGASICGGELLSTCLPHAGNVASDKPCRMESRRMGSTMSTRSPGGSSEGIQGSGKAATAINRKASSGAFCDAAPRSIR